MMNLFFNPLATIVAMNSIMENELLSEIRRQAEADAKRDAEEAVRNIPISDDEEEDYEEEEECDEEEEVTEEDVSVASPQERISDILSNDCGLEQTEPTDLCATDLVLHEDEYERLADLVDGLKAKVADLESRQELDNDWLTRHDNNVRKAYRAELKETLNNVL